jgi:hypothetical protein
MLLDLDVDLGNDLSTELDDRWFNLLFYRPAWLCGALDHDTHAAVAPGLDLMHKRSCGEHMLTADQRAFLVRAWRDAVATGHFGGRTARRRARTTTVWTTRRTARFVRSAPVQSGRPAWGWKEPISHLIAPDLIAHFPDARYVHLMRHGLDMAFSQNRRQVRRFGRLLDSDLEKHDVGPQDILRYWIRANRRVVDVVRAADPSRTHIVVFDDLCTAPAREIARLLEFLEIAVDTGRLDALCDIPRPPASMGRHRSQDLTVFDPADLQEVARLGFRL